MNNPILKVFALLFSILMWGSAAFFIFATKDMPDVFGKEFFILSSLLIINIGAVVYSIYVNLLTHSAQVAKIESLEIIQKQILKEMAEKFKD